MLAHYDDGSDGPVLIVTLCVVGLIGTAIGSFFLRAACWLFNRFTRGIDASRPVSEPTLVKATGIVFVASLVNMVIGFGLGYVTFSLDPGEANSPAYFQANVNDNFLPGPCGDCCCDAADSFGNAFLVALLCFMIASVISIVFGSIVVMLFLPSA
jgi:hypothetical protein